MTAAQPVVMPQDIVAGLGTAPRELLAACLALFEDTTLRRRIASQLRKLANKIRQSAPEAKTERADVEAAASVRSRMEL